MTELVTMYAPAQEVKKKKKDCKGLLPERNLGDGAEKEASVFLLSVGYYLSVKPIKILVG